jgi:NADH-quinone oxidoreductase subunit L
MPHLDHPGLLYVAATLVPLASFVILLLVGGVRSLIRSLRGDVPYRGEGGHPPGPVAAYIATGAIGLSFVLSLVGFFQYISEHPEPAHHEVAAPAEAEHPSQEPEGRWSDRLNWVVIGPQPLDKEHPTPASSLQLGYHIDSLAAVMFLMVTFIAMLIHVFSIGYMGDELKPVVEDHMVPTTEGHLHRRGRFGRFFMFMSLFCFSMLNLILADNLFQVFVSWELVGLCSYLLIGFYFERHSASTAANKAFITNRVGDAGFIIGLLILWTYLGTFNFADLFRQVRAPASDVPGQTDKIVRADVKDTSADIQTLTVAGNGAQVVLFPTQPPQKAQDLSEGQTLQASATPKADGYHSMPYWLLVLSGLGIFLGCVGKSAQFPLHVWLPDAMEGPTPVSALIHAATMVAAGVYLVGRVYPLFTPEARLVIAYTGGITLFVAATIAVVMTDIKKVLAYSTVSQLGYMMLALGVGGWVAGLFHLVTHAFFKALLFLCSGSVIYGCHHEQDMLKMGGLRRKMGITAWTMFIGVLTIAGIPFFSGWYSKDAILAQALDFWKANPQHVLLFLLPLATAGLTTFYMFRMWLLTFTGRPRDEHVYEHAHESPPVMWVPLVILAVCSIAVAWGWPMVSAEGSVLYNLLHHSQHGSVLAEFGPIKADDLGGWIALGLVLLAILFAYLIFYFRVLDAAHAKAQFPGLHAFLFFKWYFDELYSAILVRPALVVANWCRAFDATVIDGFVALLAWLTVLTSRWDGKFDLGIVDGLVNLTSRVIYAAGDRLRVVQTGYIRSYVLFLVLAAVGIFVVLSYLFVSVALAAH